MNNINLNRNHTLVIFFLSLFFYFSNSEFNSEILPVICFFLITTIGISHGALDHQKGRRFLKIINLNRIEFFYLAYIIFSLLIILTGIILPTLMLIIFLLAASYHFGKEDSVFENRPNTKFFNFFLLAKGSLIILAPLIFHSEETLKIFKDLDVEMLPIDGKILITFCLLSLISNFFICSQFRNSFLSSLDSVTIILLNLIFTPLIAFTVYFCFLHSIRHSFSLINEINRKNFKKGLIEFSKKALPLTFLTGTIFLISLFILNKYYLLDSAILKVVFIGLASLTFPHILLEYLLEKNEK
jgi:Brp/Blh family beta-carotene 15,15'-monooxygenase